MKYAIVSFVLLFFFSKVNAQSSVIAASGSNTTVDWTIGDVINESITFVVTGDIKEEQNVNIYPIPFNNEFLIEPKDSNGPLEFSLFDASGKTVTTTFTTEGSVYRVNASSITSGLYMLVIKKPNSTLSQVFKIIKK